MRHGRQCGCRNHRGTPKVQHGSWEAALTVLLSRHIQHGAHSIYPCPRKSNVWHVGSRQAQEAS